MASRSNNKACSECKNVYGKMQRFANCPDPECSISLCEACLVDHFKIHRDELKRCYRELGFDLELLLKKVSIHVQYDVVVLEQIKFVETEQLKQRLRDYPTNDVVKLNRNTEKRLKQFLAYQDTLNFNINLIENSVSEILTTNSFDRLMNYKYELKDKKKEAYRDLDVTMIEREIEKCSPFEEIHEKINAGNVRVKKLDAKDEQTVEQILDAVRSDMNLEKTSLAVVGRMKAGKSEFINTFRGKKPNDRSAAQVKIIECTKDPTPYEFVKGDHTVVLYDCPGFGSNSKPQKGYINVLKALNCDVYLYLYNEAITEFDEVVLSDMKKELKREIFIARTHADEDFKNEFYNYAGDEYEDANESLKEKYFESTKNLCKKYHEEEVKTNQFLKKVHWDSKVHYISCRLKWVDKFDYQELFEDICKSLPKRKRENILMVSNTHVLHLLEEKKKSLAKRISRISDAAAWESLTPFKTCNAYQRIVDAEVELYLNVFDLSEESVKMCGVNDCLRRLWKEVEGLNLDVFDFKPAKDEVNFKSIGLTVAMYAPIGLGALVAWPVNKSTSVKYLTDQLENIYRISKASFSRAFESLEHEFVHNERTTHDNK